MGKVVFRENREGIFVINYILPTEIIYYKELEVIRSGKLREVLPVTVEYKWWKVRLVCQGEKQMTLATGLQQVQNNVEFLNLLINVLGSIVLCKQYGLYMNHLCLDFNHIYVDKETGRYLFIYWPIVNSTCVYSVKEFFLQISTTYAYMSGVNSYEKQQLIEEYQNFIKQMDEFEFSIFQKFLHGLQKKYVHQTTPVTVQWAQEIPEQFFQRSNGLKESGRQSEVESIEEIEEIETGGRTEYFPELANEGEHTENMIVAKAKKEEEPMHLFLEDRKDEKKHPATAELTVVTKNESSGFYLLRMATNEKIRVSKTIFRIGKNKRYVDYAIEDNPAISSIHADIVLREGRCYFYDNHSTNKSYIEDKRANPDQEMEIYVGSRVRLANEEFMFLAYS